jgi:hypothetical protein
LRIQFSKSPGWRADARQPRTGSSDALVCGDCVADVVDGRLNLANGRPDLIDCFPLFFQLRRSHCHPLVEVLVWMLPTGRRRRRRSVRGRQRWRRRRDVRFLWGNPAFRFHVFPFLQRKREAERTREDELTLQNTFDERLFSSERFLPRRWAEGAFASPFPAVRFLVSSRSGRRCYFSTHELSVKLYFNEQCQNFARRIPPWLFAFMVDNLASQTTFVKLYASDI